MPEAIYMSKWDELMAKRTIDRDASGNVPPPKPRRGSYAE